MRIFIHGQDYDMVERPFLDVMKSMVMQAGLVKSIHPEVVSK